MYRFGPSAPVGSGGARSAPDWPFHVAPIVGPVADAAVITRDTDVECVGPDGYWPVIASVDVPAAAAAVVVTVSVALCPAVTAAGANAPLAPAGSPLIDRLTERAVPEATCVSTLYVVLEPWTTVCADGLALIAKSSSTSADTVRLTAVECVAPDGYWPAMDSVNVPVAAVVVVAMVRTELPPAVRDARWYEPVAYATLFRSDRLTERAVPEATCVSTVYVVLEPWTTVCADGLAAIAKSSSTGAVTVRLTAVVCVAGGEL